MGSHTFVKPPPPSYVHHGFLSLPPITIAPPLPPFSPLLSGSTEEEVTQVVSASIREKLMSGTGRPIVWDGSSEPTDGYLKAIKVGQPMWESCFTFE